tara:strand:+ start:612 stop:854 length:243 start_codon:yes stop_codon:yes gene_type:complete
MKITISQVNGTTVSWESPDDGHDINDAVREFKGLLVAFGYHPVSVDRAIYSDDAYEWNLIENQTSCNGEEKEENSKNPSL